jgi:neopullulanase
VFYAVMPDRFARDPAPPPAPPFDPDALAPWDAPPDHLAHRGGDLRGLAARLDELVELGVSALYLTPIAVSPTYHRYKPIDHLRVDPLLGGDAAFDALLGAAHARGIRIVLDGVFNHVGVGFPPFQDVLEYGSRSPWRGWFRVESFPLAPHDAARPGYRGWNGNRTMPELAHEHPAVRAFVLEVVERWLRRGIDGWRFDAPRAVGDAAFWRELRRRARAVNPEAYLVGEIWDDASAWLDGTQWDGQTAYGLQGALLRFAAGARVRPEHLVPGTPPPVPLDGPGFAGEVAALLARHAWPVPLAHLTFLSTHDTARFVTAAGGDRTSLALAALLLFTLPGAPCIYYGDEVGMEGGLPPASRGTLPPRERWDLGLRALFARLARLRRTSAALAVGRLRLVHAAGALVVYEREHGGERVTVAVNAGETPEAATLPRDGSSGPEPVVAVGIGAGEVRAAPASAGAAPSIVIPPRTGAAFAAAP